MFGRERHLEYLTSEEETGVEVYLSITFPAALHDAPGFRVKHGMTKRGARNGNESIIPSFQSECRVPDPTCFSTLPGQVGHPVSSLVPLKTCPVEKRGRERERNPVVGLPGGEFPGEN